MLRGLTIYVVVPKFHFHGKNHVHERKCKKQNNLIFIALIELRSTKDFQHCSILSLTLFGIVVV